MPWPVLVELWSSYNQYLAHVIASLPPESGSYAMTIGDNPSVDLLWIAVDYVEHLKHHLNQVLGPRFESTYPNTPFDRAAVVRVKTMKIESDPNSVTVPSATDS